MFCSQIKHSNHYPTLLPSGHTIYLWTLWLADMQWPTSIVINILYAHVRSLSLFLSLFLSLSLSPSSQAFVPSSASFSSYVFCWGSRSTMGWSFWRFLSQMRRLGGMPVCSLKTIPSASSSSISLSVSYVVCGHILDHCSPLAVYIHVQL